MTPEQITSVGFLKALITIKGEYTEKLREAFDELDDRRLRGVAPIKEQVAGQILEIGYFRNSKMRHLERKEEGRFYVASPKNKAIIYVLSRKYVFQRSKRLNKFLRKFLSK